MGKDNRERLGIREMARNTHCLKYDTAIYTMKYKWWSATEPCNVHLQNSDSEIEGKVGENGM